MVDLGTLGGTQSEANAVSDHGQIVGSSTTKSGRWHAVTWTKQQ
jgi:probable HAF family extracellular repeat protein